MESIAHPLLDSFGGIIGLFTYSELILLRRDAYYSIQPVFIVGCSTFRLSSATPPTLYGETNYVFQKITCTLHFFVSQLEIDIDRPGRQRK